MKFTLKGFLACIVCVCLLATAAMSTMVLALDEPVVSSTPPVADPDPVSNPPPAGGSDPTANTPPAGGSDPTTNPPPADGSDPTANPPPTDGSDPSGNPPPADGSDPSDNPPPADGSDPSGNPPPADGSDPSGNPPPADGSDPSANPPPAGGSDPVGGADDGSGAGSSTGATPTPLLDEHGHLIPLFDGTGSQLPTVDESGNPISRFDENGSFIPPVDVDGNQIPLFDATGAPIVLAPPPVEPTLPTEPTDGAPPVSDVLGAVDGEGDDLFMSTFVGEGVVAFDVGIQAVQHDHVRELQGYSPQTGCTSPGGDGYTGDWVCTAEGCPEPNGLLSQGSVLSGHVETTVTTYPIGQNENHLEPAVEITYCVFCGKETKPRVTLPKPDASTLSCQGKNHNAGDPNLITIYENTAPTCCTPALKKTMTLCKLCGFLVDGGPGQITGDAGARDPNNHNFMATTDVIAKTCVSAGFTVAEKCSYCGKLKGITPGDEPLKHNFQPGATTGTPCDGGTTTYWSCNRGCKGWYNIVTEEIDENDPSHYAITHTNLPKCNVEGLDTYVCNFGVTAHDHTNPVPGLQHKEPSDFTVISATVCFGTEIKVKRCELSGCNELLVDQSSQVEHIGLTTISAIPATSCAPNGGGWTAGLYCNQCTTNPITNPINAPAQTPPLPHGTFEHRPLKSQAAAPGVAGFEWFECPNYVNCDGHRLDPVPPGPVPPGPVPPGPVPPGPAPEPAPEPAADEPAAATGVLGAVDDDILLENTQVFNKSWQMMDATPELEMQGNRKYFRVTAYADADGNYTLRYLVFNAAALQALTDANVDEIHFNLNGASLRFRPELFNRKGIQSTMAEAGLTMDTVEFAFMIEPTYEKNGKASYTHALYIKIGTKLVDVTEFATGMSIIKK